MSSCQDKYGGGRVYSMKKKNHRNSDFSFTAGGLK